MPQLFKLLFQKKSTEHVNKLKYFFNFFLALIEDKDSLEKLAALVEEPQTSVKLEKKVNHIGKRLKIDYELKINS